MTDQTTQTTAELKKLAEAATQGDTKASGNGVHVRTRCVLTTHMEPPEQRQADARFYAAANPAAILELLAINEALVEALKFCKGNAGSPELVWESARAALARHEGGKE